MVLVGLNYQFVSRGAVSNLLCYIIWQDIEVLNAFPCVKTEAASVVLVSIEALENWLCEDMAIYQLFRPMS